MKLFVFSLVMLGVSHVAMSFKEVPVTYFNTKDKYIFEEDGSLTIEVYQHFSVQSDAGKSFSKFYLNTYDFSKLQSFSMIIYDSNGKKVKKLGKKQCQKFSYSPEHKIGKEQIIYLDPKYQNYPFRVEVSYEIKYDKYLSVPTWMPRDEFKKNIQKAELEIVHPEFMILNTKRVNIDKPIRSRSEDIISLKYSISDLTETDHDISYKEFIKSQPKVLITPETYKIGEEVIVRNRSWQEFGEWYMNLNCKPFELKRGTEEFLAGISGTDEVRINLVYEFFQDKVRYVPANFGVGSLNPLSTSFVEENGYGHNSALATYLKNLLYHIGIESHYVFLKAGKETPDIHIDFPSHQFNRVLLGVPLLSDTIFLECTSSPSPPNYLGDKVSNRHALWMKKGKSKLIRLPKSDISENIRTNIGHIHLDKNGEAILNLEQNNHGSFYSEFSHYLNKSEEDIEEYHNDKFDFRDFTVTEFYFNQPDRFSPHFTCNYKMNIAACAKKLGDKMITPINVSFPFENYIEYNSIRKSVSVLNDINVKD